MFRRRRERGSPRKPADPRAVYLGLRDQLASGTPSDLRLEPTGRFPHVWGVLFEQGMDDATVTVVSLADGTTSLYTSTGGGVIGGGGHAQVVEATYRFLDAAEALLGLTTASDPLPLPGPDEVRFNVLTYQGGRTAVASMQELEGGQHPLFALFVAAHGVITQLRLMQEAEGPAQ